MGQSDISFGSQGGRKRSRARRESLFDPDGDTASTRSQKPSLSPFEYRSKVLEAAKLYVVNEVAKGNIEHITERTLTPDEEARAKELAGTMCQEVKEKLKGGNREDDCLEPVQRCLERLGGDLFVYPRKADLDPRLKPTIQQKLWVPRSVEVQPQNSRKTCLLQQQQAPQICTPPPDAAVKFDDWQIKTPRPDITLGFRDDVFIEALGKQGMESTDIVDFLNSYQLNDWLPSEGTKVFMAMRMPFMLVEGKSYTTGGHILEAQNQGMVGVASLGLLLKKLDDLVAEGSSGSRRRSGKSRGSKPSQPHAASVFLVCTQRSWLELWAHGLEVHGDVSIHKMNLVTSANALIAKQLEDFLLLLAKIFDWASTEHLAALTRKIVRAKAAAFVQA